MNGEIHFTEKDGSYNMSAIDTNAVRTGEDIQHKIETLELQIQ